MYLLLQALIFWLVLPLITIDFRLPDPFSLLKPLKLATLPKSVRESSGLETGDAPGTFITHGDAGNAPTLFEVSRKGQLLRTITVPGAANIDWEDITRDTSGNLYICDTGDNDNKRQQLQLYKLSLKNPSKADLITFEYPDRKQGKSQANARSASFDCEAAFWYNRKIYLLTKDRENGQWTKLYELPDKKGHYQAKLIGSYAVDGKITAADLSPDHKTLVLLSNGKLHVYKPSGTNFLKQKTATVDLGKVGQTEGLAFTNNTTVAFTNEKGDLYEYKLK